MTSERYPFSLSRTFYFFLPLAGGVVAAGADAAAGFEPPIEITIGFLAGAGAGAGVGVGPSAAVVAACVGAESASSLPSAVGDSESAATAAAGDDSFLGFWLDEQHTTNPNPTPPPKASNHTTYHHHHHHHQQHKSHTIGSADFLVSSAAADFLLCAAPKPSTRGRERETEREGERETTKHIASVSHNDMEGCAESIGFRFRSRARACILFALAYYLSSPRRRQFKLQRHHPLQNE